MGEHTENDEKRMMREVGAFESTARIVKGAGPLPLLFSCGP